MLGIGRDGAGPRHLEIQGGNEAMRPSDLLMEHRRITVTRMIDRHGDLEGQMSRSPTWPSHILSYRRSTMTRITDMRSTDDKESIHVVWWPPCEYLNRTSCVYETKITLNWRGTGISRGKFFHIELRSMNQTLIGSTKWRWLLLCPYLQVTPIRDFRVIMLMQDLNTAFMYLVTVTALILIHTPNLVRWLGAGLCKLSLQAQK